MSDQSLLYKAPGELRAPWRLGIFIIAGLASVAVCSVVLGPIFSKILTAVGAPKDSATTLVFTLALLIATAFMVRVVDRKSWSEVWLGRSEATPGLFTGGFLIGALAIAIPIGLLIAVGWLQNDGGDEGSWFVAMLRITLLLLPAALLEEVMFRGYVLAVLRDWIGWKWAIAATSIAFGLLHLSNPGASVVPILLVIGAGFFLAGVLYVTKSLYAAWMAHFAWNWTMAVCFHIVVSGIPMDTPNYHYVDAGPDWATGGPWGPEGGVPAGLGMGAAIALLYTNKQRREAEAEERREKSHI